jgi:hypothetical protein
LAAVSDITVKFEKTIKEHQASNPAIAAVRVLINIIEEYKGKSKMRIITINNYVWIGFYRFCCNIAMKVIYFLS